MARTYSAIMALIGMLVVLMRAIKNGGSFDTAITSALVWMTVLGVIGVVIGSIAEMTVVESVRLRLENELAQRQAKLERKRQQKIQAEAPAAEASA